MHSHYARRLLSPAAAPPAKGHLLKTFSIPIAVVVCASLAYVLLDSIIRMCHRRHPGHPTHPQPPDHPPPPDPECLAQLSAMPFLLYHLPPPSLPPPEKESCSVCLADYEEGEEVRALPKCGHMFHSACIDQWLLTRSSFCPVCRARVIKRDVEPMDVSSRRNSNGGRGGGGSVVSSPTRALTLLSSTSNGHFSSVL